MPLSDKNIIELLVKSSYLSEEEGQSAIEYAGKEKEPVTEVLFEQGLLTPQLLEGALAEHYKLEIYDIQANPPEVEVVNSLPEALARKLNVIAVERDEKSITVAISDPEIPNLEDHIRNNIDREDAILPDDEDLEPPKEEDAKDKKSKDKKDKEKSKKEKEKEEKAAKAEAAKKAKEEKKKKEKEDKKTKKGGLFSKKEKDTEPVKKYKGKLKLVYASADGIKTMFIRYRKPLVTRFQSIIDTGAEIAPEILTEIINDAIQLRASDIHFEPQGNELTSVRFRVDGVMHEAGRIPKVYYEGVVNRIKIESNMRIDEHFAPQDGAIRHTSPDGNSFDIRVSMVPVVDGEKVVMRILASYVRALTLKDLGFSRHNQEVLTKAAHKPFGMILTTGPTGSGKSTTLYALVIIRNTPDVNISTIEDPVEYKIAGINHIQANPEADLTFASGLRALVRQDPDVILVGEIRDGETADIAVNAALTGHLLFSTLHSNDAPTAVPRLLDMGVEPFLLASTLEVIVGQRLIRRICPQCRYSYSIPAAEAHKLFRGAKSFFTGRGQVTLYKGKGCDNCGGTGYKGRIGIHELLEVTPEIEDLITAQKTSTDIMDLARKQGMKLMFEDGFEKVMAGITTLEELMRMAAPPDVVLNNAKRRNAQKD